MFAAVIIAALFLLLSVSRGAPVLTCEELVRPRGEVDCHDLDGTWTLLAGSISHPASLEALRLRDSITMGFSQSCANGSFYTQANRLAGRCHYLPYNVSIDNSRFTFQSGGRFNLSGAFLHTSWCPDCAVVRWDVETSRRGRSLDVYLLSRSRREVTAEEMQEYEALLECLGLPPPVVMDPTQEVCPDSAGAARGEQSTHEARAEAQQG